MILIVEGGIVDSAIESMEGSSGQAPKENVKQRLALYTRSRRLVSQNGHYLEIRDGGIVQGTEDSKSPYTLLQILSIGADMLTIWGSKAAAYLSVDHHGFISTTKNENSTCVFMELFTKDYFNVYGSFRSIDEERPKCLHIMEDGSLEMKDFFGTPARTCKFYWEMLSV